jgi:hypothetical protein
MRAKRYRQEIAHVFDSYEHATAARDKLCAAVGLRTSSIEVRQVLYDVTGTMEWAVITYRYPRGGQA